MFLGTKRPRLSRAEEAELAARRDAGDPVACNELVEANLPLAIHLAKPLMDGRNNEDLVAAGMLGLVKAAERFTPHNRGRARFATYATYWIRLEMRQWLHSDQLVAHPCYLRNRDVTCNRSRSPRAYERLLQNLERAAAARRDHESLTVTGRIMADEEMAVPADRPSPSQVACDTAESIEGVAPLLAPLSDVQRAVIIAHFGLDRRPQRNLSQIGKTLGLCRERIRQIKRDALKVMRDEISKDQHHCACFERRSPVADSA